MIHELALGERRIDLVFVLPSDIIGVEIKGPRDKLTDGRLGAQMREYNFYLPEVWLVVAHKWIDHEVIRSLRSVNLMVATNGHGLVNQKMDQDPFRDEMCCSRLLERLWSGEALRIAQETGLVQPQLAERWPTDKIRKLLARMMTGHEIMREVCRALRERPQHMTGLASDPPIFLEKTTK